MQRRIPFRLVLDHLGRLVSEDPEKVTRQILTDVLELSNRLRDPLKNFEGRDAVEGDEILDFVGALEAPVQKFRLEHVTKERVLRLVRRLHDRYPATGLPEKISAHERSRIRVAANRGYLACAEEHQVDVAAAEIHARAPWMREASTIAMRSLRGTRDTGVRIPPMILVGPPGTGKTSWASHLADVISVPVVKISATSRGIFSLAGVEAGWGTAQPGAVVSSFVQNRCGNPVVIIDEIDKAPVSVSASNGKSIPSIVDTILDMSEPSSSADWTCPHLRIRFDLSRVSWILTANDEGRIPSPLLDRFRVVRVDYPTIEELVDLAYTTADARLGPEVAAAVVDALIAADRRGQRPTLRTLERMISSAEAVTETPVLN